jgi:hypothetical protein
MPRGDKTGPDGQGAMTGRKAGFCTGNETAGYLNGVEFGARYGNGGRGNNRRGLNHGISNYGGRGRRFWSYQSNLEGETNNSLRAEISELRRRINELENKS